MKTEQLSEAIGRIDDAYLREAEETGVEETNVHTVPVKRSRLRWGVLAACLVLAAMIGVSATAFVAEAKEYNAAVAFFEENGLSLEGLSRAEVKAVYRDITEQRFTYEKTAEVIRRTVPGLEIAQAEPTPDEVAALWDQNVSEFR